jgi:hypothetical protein
MALAALAARCVVEDWDGRLRCALAFPEIEPRQQQPGWLLSAYDND